MRTLSCAIALAAASVAAEAAEQKTCGGVLYLGNGHSNGLFVDVPTGQAAYTRKTEEPQSMLQAMRQFRQQHNVKNCGEKCVSIRLEEGSIVLAFRPGSAGFAYEIAKVRFKITEVARDFGLGVGDLYWIEYRGGDPNNLAGIFLYSTTQGVLSLSMTDRVDVRTSALGSTLSLVQRPGLLSDACALR
jgi:hypothetical protein